VIINSLLENDFYIFTMWQLVLHQFPRTHVEYKFRCRNHVDLLPFKEEIEQEIDNFCSLKFTKDELEYLKTVPFLASDFTDYLEDFRPKRKCIEVQNEQNELAIKISGTLLNTIIFEIPILAIVSEVYFHHKPNSLAIGREKLYEKISLIKSSGIDLKFADFGLRRRYSSAWQDEIDGILKKELPDNFVGTSNVFLAKKHSIKYIGTFAHLLIQLGQGLPNVHISESQRFMLDAWVNEYRGDLGIALSDTLGFDAFLRDFDLFFAKLYDGCRHDSGDPYVWCEKLIAHYEKLRIDPRTKTAVFSDGLTFPLALDLHSKFSRRIKTSFGIGTNLTNDTGVDPLQNVIKLVKVNGYPVAKVSDSSGKGMCEDDEYLKYLKTVFKIGS